MNRQVRSAIPKIASTIVVCFSSRVSLNSRQFTSITTEAMGTNAGHAPNRIGPMATPGSKRATKR